VTVPRLANIRWVVPVLAAAALAGVVFRPPPASPHDPVASPVPQEETQGKLWRLREKEGVARDLVAGRLTLLDAAARFRALDRVPPAHRPGRAAELALGLDLPHAGETDWRCLEVISWAHAVSGKQPPGRERAVIDRFMAEFRAAGGGAGTLRIPDDAPGTDVGHPAAE
jgi:hypothetical protein